MDRSAKHVQTRWGLSRRVTLAACPMSGEVREDHDFSG